MRIDRMEGCGHDPFEEDVQGFVAALEKSFRMRVKYNAKLN
jgi:hypothetical protein